MTINGIIYLITCKITGEMYVGQTRVKLIRRWQGHCCNKYSKYRLGRAILKYGKDNFYIDQIDTASSISELDSKEIYWIDKLNTLSPNGYNLNSGGRRFSIVSKETKIKIGNKSRGNKSRLGSIPWNKGKKASNETRLKLSESHKGIIPSEKTLLKRSQSLKGRIVSQETIDKMVRTRKERDNFKHTEESKAKLSKFFKGRKRGNLTDEHKKNIGNGTRGKKYPGRKITEEVKLKIIAGHMNSKPNKNKKYKGVSIAKNKFQAVITVNRKKIHLGTFEKDIDAAKAYDDAVYKYYPLGSYVNFPVDKKE